MRNWKNRTTHETRKATLKPAGYGWYEVGGIDDTQRADFSAIAAVANVFDTAFSSSDGGSEFAGSGGDFGGGGSSGDY